MDLAEAAHAVVRSFPLEEQYALCRQLRRCAYSVPSNIAEGAGRASVEEKRQFLIIARGSLCELETQLLLAARFGYISSEDPIFTLIDRLSLIMSKVLKTYTSK